MKDKFTASVITLVVSWLMVFIWFVIGMALFMQMPYPPMWWGLPMTILVILAMIATAVMIVIGLLEMKR